MIVLEWVGRALAMAGNMAWEILWPLILGFTLSAVIQAVVRRERISGLMAGDSPRALSIATGLGAASSSCSYAAVALATVVASLAMKRNAVTREREPFGAQL